MKSLIGMAVGMCILMNPVYAQTAKIKKDCVHIMCGSIETYPLGYDLANELNRELDRILFQSNKYIHSSRDAAPALRVDISIKMIEKISQEGADSPEKAAFSVAYVFFPGSIDFYAYSNCWLLDTEPLEAAARILDREIEVVYAVPYPRAEDMKRIYDAHVLAEKGKLEKLKKKGELE